MKTSKKNHQLADVLMLMGAISLLSFTSSAAEANATEMYVGSVLLRPGEYLAEGSTTPVFEKPSGDYIAFTGGTVNMYDFDYTGPGYTVNHSGSNITAAIHLNGKSAIYVNGENSINITGDTYCNGIFSSGSLTIRDSSYSGSSLDISGSVKTGIYMPVEGSKLNVFYAAVSISGATVENSYGIMCNGDIDFGSNAYINISAMRYGITSSSKIDFTSYSSVNIEVSRIALEGRLSTAEINFKGGYVCLKAGQYIVDCEYNNITGLENLNGVAGVNKNGSGAAAFNKSDILTYKYAELVHNTFKEYHYGLIGNKFVTPGVKLSEIEITLDEFFCYNSLIKDFTPGAWKKSIKKSSELTDFTECAADEAAQDGYYYLKEFTVSFKEGVIVDTSKAYLNFRGVSGYNSYNAKCLSNGDGTYLLYIYDNYVTGDDVFNEEEGYSLTIKNYLPDYDISAKIDEGDSAGLYALPYSDYKKFARWENMVNLDKVSNYADFDPLKYSFIFKMPAYDVSVEAVYEPCGIFIDGVELKDGDYLPSGAAAATKEKPASGGYAYYNNRVLTLDNFTCTSGGMSLYQDYDDRAIILIPGSCDIILKGKNVLTGVGKYVSGIYTASAFYDEATEYELDGGNINITAENDASLELIGISECGIYTDEGKLTVNGGTITVNSINRSFSTGDLAVKNCTLNLYSEDYECIGYDEALFEASAINLESNAEGVYGYGCTFNNCDVSIKSVSSFGIDCSNQKVIFNGGTYNIDSDCCAIDAHTVEINDGVFNLTAKSVSIFGNVITINSGIINCVSVSTYETSVYASDILTINGGIINLKAEIPENGTGSEGNIYAGRFIMNDGYLSCESDSEYCLGEIRYFFDYYGGQLKLKANGTSTKAWCCTEFYDKSAGTTKKAGASADGTSLTDFDIANAASYKYVEFSKPITATIKNVDNPPTVNFKAGDKITLTATEMAYKKFIGWRTVGCVAADPTSKKTEFTFYYGGAEIEALYECTHTGGTATCKAKAKCTVCGEEYGTLLAHTYKNTTTKATFSTNGSIVKKCTVCGNVASKTTINYVKSVTLSATSYTYNGSVKTPTVTVKDSAGKVLKKDTDYTVTYADGRKNAGTYNVTVKMKGNYTGTKTLSFKIKPIDISACTVKLSATSYTFNGNVKTPTVTVKNSYGVTLTEGKSYDVTYDSGRKNAGTYKVKVTMKGNYTGTKTLSFKINPIDISTCTVKLSATSYTFNGNVKTPTVTVKNSYGTTLTKDKSYTVTYASGRKNAGTYNVTVKMKGNYTGTKTLSFKINPINISDCTVKLSATSYTYNGGVKTPTVTVTNSYGTKLTKDVSYTVTYASGRKAPGTYNVTVKMKGNYTGTKTLSFKINPIDISSCNVKLSATSYTYNGAVRTPTVTVTNSYGTKLTLGTHYSVTYATGRKAPGTYNVTVKMKGNYTGTKTLSFKINPISISTCNIKLSSTSFTYDGKVKAPTVTVTNSYGTKLTFGTHYSIIYSSGRKNVGTYNVTIKMKGNYTGSKTLTFKINPPKTTVASLVGGTKAITVNVSKQAVQTTGYQIQYATNKNFTNAKTIVIANNTTLKATLRNLNAATTYYIRVRTYKTVSNVTYYSDWSAYKYVKTK